MAVYDAKAIINSRIGRFIAYVAWIGVAVAAMMFLQAAFKRWITALSVTTHRVIYKRGWISRRIVVMNSGKVETVNVDQSIVGRIPSYGTIHVLGTGQGGIKRPARDGLAGHR